MPLIYASSAAVYGAGPEFREERALREAAQRLRLFEVPVRPVRAPALRTTTPRRSSGLRYFNVYGPREEHKGRMASVAFHFFNQYRANGKVKLFEGSGGYGDGEQRRDFVSVEDVVDGEPVFPRAPEVSGHLQLRHRRAQSFNDVAVATVNAVRAARAKRRCRSPSWRRRG